MSSAGYPIIDAHQHTGPWPFPGRWGGIELNLDLMERRGLDAALCRTIAAHPPGGLAYLSCNPATLARDLQHLCAELREEIISTVSHTGGHLGATFPGGELTFDDGSPVLTAVTDANGRYSFTQLGAGQYFVDVTDENGILAGLRWSSGWRNSDESMWLSDHTFE